MKAKSRQSPIKESISRLESMLQRFAQALPLGPWFRFGMSDSALRRTAARLRAGTIRPGDPEVSPEQLADILERAIAQRVLLKMTLDDAREFVRLYHSVGEKYETAKTKRYRAAFHRLKKSSEAKDPESRAARRVRRIHRARRNMLGRPRRRRSR